MQRRRRAGNLGMSRGPGEAPGHGRPSLGIVGGALAPAGRYRVPVRPQQIVTMHFRTSGSVEKPKPRTEWDGLAPEHKRAALREYSEEKKHPSQGA